MARKPKIQAVVDEALFEQFQQWKLDKGYETDGDAIRAILHKVISGDIGEISADNEMDSRVEKIENMLGESLDRIKQLEEEVSHLKAPLPKEDDSWESLMTLDQLEQKHGCTDNAPSDDTDTVSTGEEIKESEDANDKTPSDGTGGESYPSKSNDHPSTDEIDQRTIDDLKEGLNGKALCERFGIKPSALSQHKKKAFEKPREWDNYCASHDPLSLYWRIEGKRYYPQVTPTDPNFELSEAHFS